MRITNLAGVFTGAGFIAKQGRKVNFDDAAYVAGPVDIVIDDKTGLISEVSPSSQPSKSLSQNLAAAKRARRNTRYPTSERQRPRGFGIGSKAERAFDGQGLIATAGFVDSHTHTLFTGERSGEFFLRWRGATYAEVAASGAGIHNTNNNTLAHSDEALIAQLRQRLRKARSSGTTTIELKTGYGKDATGELRLLRVLKQARSGRHHDLPDSRVTFLGLHALPKSADEGKYVDEMIAILNDVRREDLADFVDAFPEKGFFSLEQSLRFIDEGAKRGLGIKVHADEITDMKAALTFARKGALSVDHLQQISDEGIEALAQSKTVAALLPSTSFFLGLPYAKARKLLDAGARVALATDYNPGTAPKADMPFTLLLAASQFKMSPAEILCASTLNGAAAMGCDHDRGALVPGRRGDILLWQTPPAKNSQEILEHILLGVAELAFVKTPLSL